jgi:hypothetical protein
LKGYGNNEGIQGPEKKMVKSGLVDEPVGCRKNISKKLQSSDLSSQEVRQEPRSPILIYTWLFDIGTKRRFVFYHFLIRIAGFLF